jgi:hypothetical protein
VLGVQGVELGAPAFGQAVLLQSVAEAQEGALVEDQVAAHIQPGKGPQGGDVVQGFFHPGVG